MKPQYILAIAAVSTTGFAEHNAELDAFISRYEHPETVRPLTRCQVSKLQSLLREEIDGELSFRDFLSRNESALDPRAATAPESDAEPRDFPRAATAPESDAEPRDFDVFISDLDRRIEAMLNEFYGPEGSC
jgi:hypothetical protein